MATIKIDTGTIRLQVECDGREETLSFNPDDVAFVEKFLSLMNELENKQEEYVRRAAELEAVTETNGFGIPINLKERLGLLLEMCIFMRGQVDEVFGVGTSQRIFGSANTLEMFEQLFNGIAPFVQKRREEKLKKYSLPVCEDVMR